MGQTPTWSVLGFSVLGAFASEASAAAWRAPKDGLAVLTSSVGLRDDTNIGEIDVYWEDRLTARFDGVLSAHVQLDERYDPPTAPGVQLPHIDPTGEVVIGGKLTLQERPGSVISAQAGVLGVYGAKDDCGEAGVEARVLAGKAKGAFFADTQGAFRVRSGGCPTGKLDITVGWEPHKSWLGLAQAFVDVDPRYDPVVKLQLSLVTFAKDGQGWQVGVRVRADEAGRDERALVVGWWRAPHKSVTP